MRIEKDLHDVLKLNKPPLSEIETIVSVFRNRLDKLNLDSARDVATFLVELYASADALRLYGNDIIRVLTAMRSLIDVKIDFITKMQDHAPLDEPKKNEV